MKTRNIRSALGTLLLPALFCSFAYSQEAPGIETRPLQPVDFLSAKPVIDGSLDPECRALPQRSFDTVETTSPGAAVHPCSYRLGYTGEGLYLAIEIFKDRLVSRDRAYQNGDGFHLVLAIPTPGEPSTREFLVLAFSPLDSTRRKAFVWYRNVDLAFTPLKLTELAAGMQGASSMFELFLPWRSIPPYHPWLLDSIGFNLCLVEASGDKEKAYHFVVLDEQIQSEQHPRLSSSLRFAPPGRDAHPALAVALSANHLFPLDTLRAIVAGIAPSHHAEPLRFEIVNNDSTVCLTRNVNVLLPPPPNHERVAIGPVTLLPGTYSVRWSGRVPPIAGESPLTVLPRFDRAAWAAQLDRARALLSSGSANTLQFLLEQLATEFEALKSYDTGRGALGRIVLLSSLLEGAQRGDDALAHQTGAFRRAYRSDLDGTLQPYSVRIPRSYSSTTPAPLLVYLHGSGEDDQGIFDRDTIDDGFIRLAPFGRGTSNAYTTDYAQDDIREAIDDVCRNYTIDTTRIILSGFSMGGYGVYRTFVAMPRRFRALAVFSGSPNLATRWLGAGFPDFTDPAALAPFKGMRMFIFHGGRDRNCPVEETDRLVADLRQVGAIVEYHREGGKGHESPSAEVQTRYRTWLTQLAAK